MTRILGLGVSTGRVIGPVLRMASAVVEPPADERLAADTTAAHESERFQFAANEVKADLEAMADSAIPQARDVLMATAMMAADPVLTADAAKRINQQGSSAARAVWDAAAQIGATLSSLGGYMAERATDVYDVRDRLIAKLRGEQPPGIPTCATPFVLAAIDLSPADTALLDPAKTLALLTSEGGPQSHTAILARQLGIPAVIAAPGVQNLSAGTEVYVDGARGEIVLSPSDAERQLVAAWSEQKRSQQAFDGRGSLADGTPIQLLANVGGGTDAVAAGEARAEGVGLFRTEFLFLDRAAEPTIEEQVEAYRLVFDAFPNKKVVIRTLDAGTDKPLPFVNNSNEPNPSLGIRGYRTHQLEPSILKNQLRAIGAAAAQSTADVSVMAPMISTPDETAEFVEACASAGLSQVGVMIEVPSAALMAEEILHHATFCSIGTNDLTQYVMAADRQLGQLGALNDPWQPAVLRLIKATTRVAGPIGDKSAKPVGVCGEAAADPALAVVLVGLGVTSLSMSPLALSAVSAVLRSITAQDAQRLADLALASASAPLAKQAVRAELPLLEELGL